jgi:hypothetical protein
VTAIRAAGRVVTLDELIDTSVVSHDDAGVYVEISTDDGAERAPVTAVEAWDRDVALHVEWAPPDDELRAACVALIVEMAGSKSQTPAAKRAREIADEYGLRA